MDYTEAEQGVAHGLPGARAERDNSPSVSSSEAKAALDLPADGVPSLDLVSGSTSPSPASATCPRPGWCPSASSTARCPSASFTRPSTCATRRSRSTPRSRTSSTRSSGTGILLATPTFSDLHRLTGEATHRLSDGENLRFLSRVFWFTVEFGVVMEDGELRAYGASILSSFGEIDEFRAMERGPST